MTSFNFLKNQSKLKYQFINMFFIFTKNKYYDNFHLVITR